MQYDAKILVVEDNERLLDETSTLLENAGYTVYRADTLAKARTELGANEMDLIVLDIGMPDGSGLDFCGEIRDSVNATIVFLTVNDEHDDVVNGLMGGGDDYILKPYDDDEFLARIEAHIRRNARNDKESGSIVLGPLELSTDRIRAYYNKKDILLKPKEFLLLLELARNINKTADPVTLYKEIWGQASNNDLRTVFVNISTLRKKLEKANVTNVQIEGNRDIGYKLTLL